MSNLRSDAREFAETLPPGSVARVFILRLCSQVDEVEERWHERAIQAAGMADEIVHLHTVLRDQDRVNEWRTEQVLNSLLSEALQ